MPSSSPGNPSRTLARLLAAGDPSAVEVLALAWGSIAAVAATMVANAFCLTMTFYFYAFLALALGVLLVFGHGFNAPTSLLRLPNSRLEYTASMLRAVRRYRAKSLSDWRCRQWQWART